MTQFDAEVTITKQRFANAETGFAVLDAESAGEPIVLVGPLIHLEARERAQVRGAWVTDARYGPQVKVAEARPLPPADTAALISYLRKVRHVGRKRAEALIARHGPARVLEAVDDDPAGAFGAVGLSTQRANEAAAAWHELRVTRQLHLLLAPHGLGYLVGRINAEYGATAQRVIQENPYELTRVFGVGFVVADRIARAQHRDLDAIPGRPRAAVIHLLAEAEKSGSTCLATEVLLAETRELLGRPVSRDGLIAMVREGDLVLEGDPEHGEFVYRTATAELEEELAVRVTEMVLSKGRLSDRSPDISGTGIALTEEQEAAVAAAFAHRLSVITGGPGTGKTATIRAIAAAAQAAQAKVLLMAPTGRAAARMREASGVEASTVHSALGWIPGEGPEHDASEPLRTDLLILDESSMANLELMVTLLRAVAERTHVVLVGDADQLAPVGAGKPFAELLSSGRVPSTRLTHIFRQAAGSMIVQGAHAIRRGQMPSFEVPLGAAGAPDPEVRRDLFMIERADPLAARAEIVSLVSERLPAHYGVDPVSDIQVFAPVYKGELGIDALNVALREALNGRGPAVRGGRLRLGDKVMMTGRNLHELRLMNGTLLQVIDELEGGGPRGGAGRGEDDDDAGALLLRADDGTLFRLPPEESESLRLAYACSVHRGQGIELPVAVIVAHPAAGAFFLRREMLYTAVTRAKLATIIVGTRAVLGRAAATPDGGRRVSRLADRLAGSAG